MIISKSMSESWIFVRESIFLRPYNSGNRNNHGENHNHDNYMYCRVMSYNNIVPYVNKTVYRWTDPPNGILWSCRHRSMIHIVDGSYGGMMQRGCGDVLRWFFRCPTIRFMFGAVICWQLWSGFRNAKWRNIHII